MSGLAAGATGQRAAPVGRRLAGVDVARGLALLGMMSVHVLPRTDADGSLSLAYAVSSGRASVLFAVLAGVGLALAGAGARAVLARAAVVAAIGLTLGLLPTPVAIILVNYGLLFVLAVPFLRLRARTLAMLAGAWLVVSPVVGHLLRPAVPAPSGANPSWLSLGDPVGLLTELLLTGYYPALQWTGYLLVGLAVGRSRLNRTRTAVGLVLGGLVLAAAASVLSAVLLDAGGAAAVDADRWFYGVTPTGSWWWLAVDSPHAGTPPDLLHTTGTALAVLGGCLLLAPWAGRLLLPLAAAGSMTLTLYSVHVVALGLGLRELTWHVVGALVIGTLWRSTGQRGPLEALAAAAARSAARPVSRAG